MQNPHSWMVQLLFRGSIQNSSIHVLFVNGSPFRERPPFEHSCSIRGWLAGTSHCPYGIPPFEYSCFHSWMALYSWTAGRDEPLHIRDSPIRGWISLPTIRGRFPIRVFVFYSWMAGRDEPLPIRDSPIRVFVFYSWMAPPFVDGSPFVDGCLLYLNLSYFTIICDVERESF